MTSKLTRERIELIANFHRAMALPPSHAENEELARMALAAMDSEPVAHISKSDFDAGYPHILARRDFNKACTLPVYAAQPAPEYPEVLPCPVLLEPGMRFGKGVKTRLVLEAIQRRAEHHAELEAMAPEERAEYDANIEAFKAMLPLPAPVVPDAATAIRACLSEFPESARDIVEECADIAENACRAAMLQASPVCTCPSGDGSLRWPCPVHPGNSPAQSDCCPAQNSVNPAQGGNYLVIPDEMTSEQAYEIGYYYGDPVDVFARGANWMRQHIIDSTLAAAPQSPGSEPATVPGKWIPVSERMPERGDYLVTDGCDFDVQLFNGEQFIPGFVWEDKITHWMPLPAAPQEVKGE